jgi:hypothetical protein
MLITTEEDKSLHSILASSLSLFIFATTLMQYLVFLTFTAELSPVGLGAGAGAGLGARAEDAPSSVVLAFLGGRLWALGS